MKTAFVNGEYIESTKAKISIFDRGFLFGDGVYEVIPVYQSLLCFADRHFQRLASSLKQSKIPSPQYNWQDICQKLIQLNGGGDLQIYLQVTRGNQGIRTHDIPDNLPPTVVAFTLHNPFPSEIKKQKGLHASLVEDFRWHKCNIKSISLLANILLNDEAVSQGNDTAILLRNGFLSEGSTSNVFVIDNAMKVRTSPLNEDCLPGITRQITIELLAELQVKVFEDKISKSDILNAQEIWITSTTKEIYPVSYVDGELIGTGKPGPLWTKINSMYQKLVKKQNDQQERKD
ncbi:D-amino acid aminotransferase [Legionella israelensis]|uniref:Aminodeoxychorismate lyase n=1 Tax=Legionella israelensis TaxID=454 RepID=A0A0W0VTX9_9GAMM|nr:D-amino acid aminotransferase [Legionella israelensis]KTD23648.1 D-alanine-aminotransferase [Legionella israelensis]QBR84344.1 D-amino acid aminotransferase [Legionella israelensis]QBS08612.1 D-amino acid aminotransferase [Legionella israelensis]SCY38712.1 D-alanine transaminase [Legionella israelensis DSM 19235]STX58270.1 D-alanine transaminase [Legionella israelensis]